MEIRITKGPPAPLMDGFNVHGLQVGRCYIVDRQLARYLIRAGYAAAVTPSPPENKQSDETE